MKLMDRFLHILRDTRAPLYLKNQIPDDFFNFHIKAPTYDFVDKTYSANALDIDAIYNLKLRKT
jgi:hypothetical protein